MGRPPCCDKSNVKRGLWTAEEDARLLAHVSKHGFGNWTSVPMKAGLNRCGKSCRLRWTNYLRPDLNHNDFTPQEEEHIINLHQAIGSRWSLIAKQLPGRTDNDVKNYWNTKLRKKLSKMGIDPITHKPISQILSEYGNISGLVNSGRMHIASRNMDNVFVPKSEPSSIITGFLPPTNMITRPAIEQVPDYDSFSSYNPSLDFLSKSQVINHDIVQPHFFNEVTSSCSSSSSSSHVSDLISSPQSFSCQQSQAQIFTLSSSPSSSSSLNWSEFFLKLEEETQEGEQEGDLQGLVSSTNAAILSQSETPAQKFRSDQYSANRTVDEELGSHSTYDFESTIFGSQLSNKTENSSVDSFLDTLLDRDSKLTAAFPELLDGSFGYYCAYLDDRHFPA